ncbi:MAG: hypothetical protein SGI96_21325 [Bacteroidota bacterium]|nr:hypothetical protein [Bacteroidota bacterium]
MNWKIDNKLLSLSEKEKHRIGLEVEHFLKNDLGYLVNKNIMYCEKLVGDVFGWDRDDLLQQVRIQLWRALAVFDEKATASKRTFLSVAVSNYFMTLVTKSKRKKNINNSLVLCGEDDLSRVIDDQIICPIDLYAGEKMIDDLIEKMNGHHLEVYYHMMIMKKGRCWVTKRLNLTRKKMTAVIRETSQIVDDHLKQVSRGS